LQPDRDTHAPVTDPLLNRHQQIFIATRDTEIGVAGHPNGVTRNNFEPVIEPRQVVTQDIFEQHEGVLAIPGRKRN